jgi:predicted amidohydrolase
MNALRGQLEHNLDVHDRLARDAAAAGGGLVVFPELSTTAHFGEKSVVDLAEEIGNGPVHSRISSLAADLRCVIGYGVCERAAGAFFNSYVVVGPSGIAGVQRKTHASMDEYFHFRMGGSLEILEIGGWRVGVAICADADYFEVWRILALKGADLVLLPHASRSGWGVELTTEDQKRGLEESAKAAPDRYGTYAADNSIYAAYCNQVGFNGHSTHAGGAWIAGPDGNIVAAAKPVLENVFAVATLQPEALHAARRGRNSQLRTRRPELYGELVRLHGQ